MASNSCDFQVRNRLCPPSTTPKCCTDEGTLFTVVDYSGGGRVPIPTADNANQSLIVDPTGRFRLVTNSQNNTTGPISEGYLSWNFDPLMADVALVPTSGELILLRLDMDSFPSIDAIYVDVSDPAVGLTAGQNFAGLYDGNGDLMRSSADMSGLFGAVGRVRIPLTDTFIAAPGPLYVALLFNGTTPPELWGSTPTETAVANPPLALPRFAVLPGTYTSLPTSIPIPSTVAPLPIWTALG